MKLNGITTGRRGDARIAKDRSTDWSRVMTERIDHYAAAVGMLKDAQAAQDLSMVGIIAQGAQVHATLALVEQQRITNLLRVHETTSTELSAELWNTEIKEALGL